MIFSKVEVEISRDAHINVGANDCSFFDIISDVCTMMLNGQIVPSSSAASHQQKGIKRGRGFMA